jgi:hypothetical protein
MPQLKEPRTLRGMVMEVVINKLYAICTSWIEKLFTAARTGGERYLHQTEIVRKQSDDLRDSLRDLGPQVLKDFIPKIARTFLDMITEYDQTIRPFVRGSADEETHNTGCKNILLSILSENTQHYDTLRISSSFAQSLVIHTLDSVPELTKFCLDTETEIDHSALLATKIRHLPNLLEFQYEYHCTDEVIEQLRLHCRYLRKVSFKNSTRVTDASVQHLMQLRELVFVHLEDTSCSLESYGSLLSELPRISNIVFWLPYSDLLRHIARERIHTISHVSGNISNINILTQKCPNITNLNMSWLIEDMTSVTALTALRSLQIAHGDYGVNNLNAVLQSIGHRLTELCLTEVWTVNLADIVTLCSCLENLVLDRCIFLPLDPHTTIDPKSPHFKSLISLKITKSPNDTTDYLHLRYYVNLEFMSCRGVDIFTEDFVRDAVRRGTLRNLECFYIRESGHGALTMKALELLINHCQELRSVGYAKSWPRFNPGLIRDFKRGILLRNSDLELLD